MKATEINGVFRDKNKIFTENLSSSKGLKVYNERLIKYKNKELRSWNPYRSKLGAAIIKGFELEIKPNSNVLYLGAATGTTVSHLSDIIKEGTIYAVENSAVAIKDLILVCKKRKNIIPIFNDANHPDRYSYLVSSVDYIYQDISQRNQAEIFIANIDRFFQKNVMGILMVKARSIDVSLKPKKAYEIVCDKLKQKGLKIKNIIELAPYEKDHAAIVVTN